MLESNRCTILGNYKWAEKCYSTYHGAYPISNYFRIPVISFRGPGSFDIVLDKIPAAHQMWNKRNYSYAVYAGYIREMGDEQGEYLRVPVCIDTNLKTVMNYMYGVRVNSNWNIPSNLFNDIYVHYFRDETAYIDFLNTFEYHMYELVRWSPMSPSQRNVRKIDGVKCKKIYIPSVVVSLIESGYADFKKRMLELSTSIKELIYYMDDPGLFTPKYIEHTGDEEDDGPFRGTLTAAAQDALNLSNDLSYGLGYTISTRDRLESAPLLTSYLRNNVIFQYGDEEYVHAIDTFFENRAMTSEYHAMLMDERGGYDVTIF